MRLSIIGLGLVALLSACGGSSVNKKTSNIKTGGTFRYNERENFTSLHPFSITDYKTTQVAHQIYEGLLKIDAKDLTIKPSLAESWTLNEDKTEYTFHLKKGVKFHDADCFEGGKGREVTAHDFKFSFEQLCTKAADNFQFTKTFKDVVVGATEFYNKENDTLKGVEVIDDYTLKIKLIQPANSFLYTLTFPATSVIAKEACEKYGNKSKIGTGPFVAATQDLSADKFIMVKNTAYHGKDTLGNKLPYLDSVVISFVNSKSKELKMLRAGELEVLLNLPPSSVVEQVEEHTEDLVGKNARFRLERTPEMYSQYYAFNMLHPVLSKKKVRQAISYAVNRQKIFDEILLAKADAPGVLGIVPPAFKGYENPQGYSFNATKAKQLLAEAGYPDGKGFPKLTIRVNKGGALHIKVADEVRKQLYSTLGINVNFDVIPYAQLLEESKYAVGDIYRASWVADYPDPEDFLSLLYGKSVTTDKSIASYPNTSRYSNPKFDELFEKGKNASTKAEAYKYFIEAEKIAMDDAPLLILWYKENYRLSQSYVKNFPINPMEHMDLSAVWLDK